jgi:tripartite-type tricarboxylate transporter receptor subunit TctC
MPRPVVERLSKAIAQALATPSIRDRLIAMGLEPATDNSPEGMAQLMKTFAQRNLALIDVAKIKPE